MAAAALLCSSCSSRGCTLILSLLSPGGVDARRDAAGPGPEAQTEVQRPGSLLEPGRAPSVEQLE